MRIRSIATFVTVSLAAFFLKTGVAHAQNQGGSWGWNTNQGYQGTGWGPPPTPPRSKPSKDSSDVEIATLYVTSAAYGVGMGIWVDAEAGIDDPGLQFIPPVALGVALPIGVYFLDDPPMPRGMPAAISAGLVIGSGEGLGVWSYQFTSADEADAWGFRGLSRAMTLGGAIGGAGGFALAYFHEPSPKSSALLGSSVMWGTVVGSMIGYGSSEAGVDYGEANESAALGGLVGYNLGLGGAAAASIFWIPSWTQLGWMWVGGGIGAAVGLPVYLAYAGSDKPAKRGLIFQGITTGLGVAAGGIFSSHLQDEYALFDETPNDGTQVAQITGFGLLPVDGGAGIQMMGLLY